MVMMEIWDVLLMGVRLNNISKDPLRLFAMSSMSLYFLIIMITAALK